jgi:hypothetical protein
VQDTRDFYQEEMKFKASPPSDRVKEMFEELIINQNLPKFLICILPEKNSSLYG